MIKYKYKSRQSTARTGKALAHIVRSAIQKEIFTINIGLNIAKGFQI